MTEKIEKIKQYLRCRVIIMVSFEIYNNNYRIIIDIDDNTFPFKFQLTKNEYEFIKEQTNNLELKKFVDWIKNEKKDTNRQR